MAMLEDPRKRAAEEKKVRIDHSDVYLENEKLGEILDNKLDTLSRRRHRQVINRDHEIKQLRRTLSSMNVTRTASAPATLRPHTTIPSFRRLRPPPVIDRLHVHVPTANNDDDNSSKGTDNDSDENDTCDHERDRNATWRKMRMQRNRVAWGDASQKEGPDARSSSKVEVKRVTQEQMLLNNLDMEAIPASWYTEVHHPSDIPIRRRASSAHPSTRSTHSTTSNTGIRRPKGETSRLRPRRVKSAIPTMSTTLSEEEHYQNSSITLLCGGGPRQQKQLQQTQQKTETMRSRRQLMELMGVGKTSESSEADSNRQKFLEAVQQERERLDVKVKLFLLSCDEVGEGGVSSRKQREYQSILLPPTSYG